MKKQTFEKGDRVFDIRYGWGIVKYIYTIDWEKAGPDYLVCEVEFNKEEEKCLYTKKSAIQMLSFTEYTLQGFTQEKPVNYEKYIGKWGMFWDSDKDILLIGKLLAYDNTENEGYPFENEFGYYANFEPLTEEQIKVLGLCD